MEKLIKEYLESLFVCQRCILRFLCYRDYKGYVSKSSISQAMEKLIPKSMENSSNGIADDLESTENTEVPSPKRHSASPCSACLGILQDSCDDMLSKVQSSITVSGFEFEDFVLQLCFPVVINLRDTLFHLHLKEQFKDSYNMKESEIPSVKDVWKWVIGSQLGKSTNSDFSPNSDFQILVTVSYPDTAKECFPLLEKYPEAFPNRNKKQATIDGIYNRTAMMKAIESADSEIKKIFPLPSIPDKSCTFKIQCQSSPIYFGGRYNKYSRELSQTPWILDGQRKMESSVNELITDVVQKWVNCDKIVFSASGREDVDVRMLGNGRPFILEVLNPRKKKWCVEDFKKIENEINESTKLISINGFQIITKEDTLLLKEGEENKKKTYSALCIVKRDLTEDDVKTLENLSDLKLFQKTPLRVLHRRTLSTRERLLHSIKADILSEQQLRLTIETQAGTYVKEFVHGDFGRTVPNLGTILNTEADILELDVQSVDLEWPPQPS